MVLKEKHEVKMEVFFWGINGIKKKKSKRILFNDDEESYLAELLNQTPVSLECWEVSFECWLEMDILCVLWSLKPLAQQSYFDNWIWSSRSFEENVFL